MLRVRNFSYRHLHAETLALNDVSFTVKAGEALLLTGRSGSGKSTLLAAIAGLVPHYYKGCAQGRIYVDDFEPRDVPLNAIGAKVGLMLQNAEVQFLAPTVAEEIFLSLKCRNLDTAQCRALTQMQLEKFKLEHIKDASVFDLSEGQKQKVVLAALTALKPKVLLLDEPTANLDPLSIAELKELLLQLRREGMTLLIADHRLSWLNGLCESIVVLDHGAVCWQGDFEALLRDETFAQLGLRTPLMQQEKLLETLTDCAAGVTVYNLSFGYTPDCPVLKAFCGAIPRGKVTVLNGPSGMGKTTLAKVLAGLIAPHAGEVYCDGQSVTKKHLPRHTRVVLQNSDHQLYMRSVLAELSLALNRHPSKTCERVRALLNGFGLEALAERHPQSLSGGEKQRLVVALGVAQPAKLLVLDEPTSGLDGHNLRLMAQHIQRLARQNLSVLVITHDVELINLCADYKLNFN